MTKVKLICTDKGQHPLRYLGHVEPETRPPRHPVEGQPAPRLKVSASGAAAVKATKVWTAGPDWVVDHYVIRWKCPTCPGDWPFRESTLQEILARLADAGVSTLDLSLLSPNLYKR